MSEAERTVFPAPAGAWYQAVTDVLAAYHDLKAF